MEQRPRITVYEPSEPADAAGTDRAAQFELWIRAARAGSREALGELLDACRGYLLSIANVALEADVRGKLGASDLVQETLLEAQRGLDQFRGTTEADLMAWLRQILHHNVADVRRRFVLSAKRQIGREERLTDGSSAAVILPGTIETPSVQVSRDEQVQRLAQALERLSADYQAVIHLRNWQLLSFVEIGARLQRTEEAARKLWVRAIDRLQDELGATDDGP